MRPYIALHEQRNFAVVETFPLAHIFRSIREHVTNNPTPQVTKKRTTTISSIVGRIVREFFQAAWKPDLSNSRSDSTHYATLNNTTDTNLTYKGHITTSCYLQVWFPRALGRRWSSPNLLAAVFALWSCPPGSRDRIVRIE